MKNFIAKIIIPPVLARVFRKKYQFLPHFLSISIEKTIFEVGKGGSDKK
jgi:hypothetical protein